MLKTVISFCILSALLLSCQKEVSYDLGNDNSGTGSGSGSASNGNRLVKLVSSTQFDSSITSYQYDKNGLLIRETVTGSLNGVDASNDYSIQRTASGIITETVQKSPTLLQNGIDSLVRTLHYDPSSKKYVSAVFPVTVNGLSVIDSTAYVYNSSGNVAAEETYENALGISIAVAKNVFTYSSDSRNITSENIYADTTGTGTNLSQVVVITYGFDTRVSALKLPGEDAFAAQREQLFNASNIVSMQETSFTSISQSFSVTQVFNYNSTSQPTSAVSVNTLGNLTVNLSYYYQ